MRDKDIETDEESLDEDDLDEELELDEDEVDGYGAFAVARGFAAGVIVGAIIGAGVAVLVTPERGDVLRRRIGSGLRDLREDARDQIGDWGGEAKRELSKHRRKLKRRLRKVRRR